MSQLGASIALFYQSNRDLVERTFIAIGLALLVGSLLHGQPVYPADWTMLLVGAVVVAGLYDPLAGYLAAVAISVWPLWQLSPYLATLFLAVAVLARGRLLRSLSWALLVTASPMLAWLLVTAIVPLLAGLLLSPAAAFWVGVAAASWLKLAGGMAGIQPDLLTLHQEPIFVSAVAARFAGANSLSALQRLVAPFAGDATFLLLDILQVLGWGLCASLVAWFRQQRWAELRPAWSLIVALLGGTSVSIGTLFLLPVWLQVAPLRLLWSDPMVVVGALFSAWLAGASYWLRYLLHRPVRRFRWRSVPAAVGPIPGVTAGRGPAASAPRPAPSSESGGDVIMLELD